LLFLLKDLFTKIKLLFWKLNFLFIYLFNLLLCRNIYQIFEEFNLNFTCFKNYEHFEATLKEDRRSLGRLFGQTYYDHVENYINENEKKLNDLVDSYNQLLENIEELIDKKFVWEKTNQLITNTAITNIDSININNNKRIELENVQNKSIRNYDNKNNNHSSEFNYNRINNNQNNIIIEEGFNNHIYNKITDIENNVIENRVFDLKIISGIISAEEELKFKKLIFRTTMGIAYPNIFELEYAENQTYAVNGRNLNLKREGNLQHQQQAKHKKIFVLCVQGQGLLMRKVLKVCDLIRAARYNIPNKNEFLGEIKKLQKEIEDKKIFLIETENSIRSFVNEREENVYFFYLFEFFILITNNIFAVYLFIILCIENFKSAKIKNYLNFYFELKNKLSK